MSRRLLGLAATVVCFAASVSGRDAQDPAPQFRAATDVVTVDVQVRSNFGPVGGLAPGDLLIVDNGVPQRVESIENTTMPVDVSVLIDLSGWTMGAWQNEPRDFVSEADPLSKFDQIRGLLRSDDRLRLLTIDDVVTEVLPMRSPVAPVAAGPMKGDGLAALNDGLVAAMLRPAEPSRRHFVFAFTKGLDTRSTVDLAALRDVARRSDAIVHIVEDLRPLIVEQSTHGCQCVEGLICRPTMRFFLPVRRGPSGKCGEGAGFDDGPRDGRHREELGEAAAMTGGGYHVSSVLQLPDLLRTFKSTIEAFRQGYVVRYTPQGVKREGWHELSVSVPKSPGYSIQARRGYWVESTGSTNASSTRSTAAPTTVRGSSAATIDNLAQAFDHGDHEGVQTLLRGAADLTRLVKDLREGGTRWPSAPRKDAVFSLEVALAVLRSPNTATADEAHRLLADYTTLIRSPLGPDAFECAWYWTAVAGYEGVIRPEIALPFVKRALERCPDDSRLRLAHAVITDQQWPTGVQWAGLSPQAALPRPPAALVRDLPPLYDAAMAFEDTALEARVRAAWFFYRAEQYDRAATLLANASALPGDRAVRYLAELVRAKTLGALKRPAEAEAAFRSALTTVPGAQSARVALMALLLARGERPEAEALARAVATAPDDQVDPWWMYWQGDYRAFNTILGRLREMAR